MQKKQTKKTFVKTIYDNYEIGAGAAVGIAAISTVGFISSQIAQMNKQVNESTIVTKGITVKHVKNICGSDICRELNEILDNQEIIPKIKWKPRVLSNLENAWSKNYQAFIEEPLYHQNSPDSVGMCCLKGKSLALSKLLMLFEHKILVKGYSWAQAFQKSKNNKNDKEVALFSARWVMLKMMMSSPATSSSYVSIKLVEKILKKTLNGTLVDETMSEIVKTAGLKRKVKTDKNITNPKPITKIAILKKVKPKRKSATVLKNKSSKKTKSLR